VDAGDADRAARLLADHIEVPQRKEEATGQHDLVAGDPITRQGGDD
jgi:hypothetical protein